MSCHIGSSLFIFFTPLVGCAWLHFGVHAKYHAASPTSITQQMVARRAHARHDFSVTRDGLSGTGYFSCYNDGIRAYFSHTGSQLHGLKIDGPADYFGAYYACARHWADFQDAFSRPSPLGLAIFIHIITIFHASPKRYSGERDARRIACHEKP